MFTFETKMKKKNIPNRFEKSFKRRTWIESQVLVYAIWVSDSMICMNLNMHESAEICLDVGKYSLTTLGRCLNMRETLRA